MSYSKIFIALLFCTNVSMGGFGQALSISKQYTLEQVIDIAQQQSPVALSAKNKFLKSFWEFRTSRARLLPKLNLDAQLPNIQRQLTKQTLGGNDYFFETAQANTSAALSLSKNIGLTGGQVFLSSSLQRIDYLDTALISYLSSPLIIGYSQSIFTFNQYRWSKKIDPIKYNEAKQKYLENVEQLSITATNYFFNLLASQIQKKIAEQKYANYDTLYKIAIGRYNLGKIPENDLLQLELQLLRAESEVETSNINFEDKMFKLKSFLRLQDDQPIELIPPVEELNFFDIPVDEAIAKAILNNSATLGFERRLLESDREVNRAKRTDRFSATLFAQYGLSQSGKQFGDAYQNPQNQQQLRIGIHVPILDWGLAKGRIKIAESDREIIRTAIEQEQIDFEQSVYLEVMNFKMQQRQIEIAAKSDTVAQKGFEVSKQRYMIGKISITDLNVAQVDKDNSQISFIRTLQEYWINYFRLRQLTLYDFKNSREITVDFDKMR
jgi:outer membrane protein TolC